MNELIHLSGRADPTDKKDEVDKDETLEETSNGGKAFTLFQLQGAFMLYGGSLILSTVVFFIEILMRRK